jgi:hypothetical protein
MYADYDERPRDVERKRLLKRMEAAEASGNKQDIADALAEAKHRLRKNFPGDNPVREVQSRLLGLLAPTR